MAHLSNLVLKSWHPGHSGKCRFKKRATLTRMERIDSSTLLPNSCNELYNMASIFEGDPLIHTWSLS